MTTGISGGEWRRWWLRRRDRALQLSTTILLTLFLPLSFLLLARLSAAGGCDDFLAFLLLYFNSAILYLLLSFVTVAAFVRALTGGRVTLIQLLLCHQNSGALPLPVDHQGSVPRRPRLSLAWLLLCTSVIFAELGFEFQLNGDRRSSPSPSSDYHHDMLFVSFPRGLLFAVGLYETMLHWSESVVEPVVEDVVAMGFSGDEGGIKKGRRWVSADRVGLGLSFGALWWWRLRDHVDSLAVGRPPTDIDPHVVVKVTDFVSLGLYYLTVSTGAVRVFTGVTGTMQLMWRRRSTPAAAPI